MIYHIPSNLCPGHRYNNSKEVLTGGITFLNVNMAEAFSVLIYFTDFHFQTYTIKMFLPPKLCALTMNFYRKHQQETQ